MLGSKYSDDDACVAQFVRKNKGAGFASSQTWFRVMVVWPGQAPNVGGDINHLGISGSTTKADTASGVACNEASRGDEGGGGHERVGDAGKQGEGKKRTARGSKPLLV